MKSGATDESSPIASRRPTAPWWITACEQPDSPDDRPRRIPSTGPTRSVQATGFTSDHSPTRERSREISLSGNSTYALPIDPNLTGAAHRLASRGSGARARGCCSEPEIHRFSRGKPRAGDSGHAHFFEFATVNPTV